jgi:hypothetical protein
MGLQDQNADEPKSIGLKTIHIEIAKIKTELMQSTYAYDILRKSRPRTLQKIPIRTRV